jgi:flagellar basal-body rod modification protein FlgD
MAVQAVNNSTAATTSTTTTSTSATKLDKNAFLNLLVSQMKYQDPMDPMKADQFMSQLAQITSVEQLQNISDSLASMKTTMEKGSATQWISTIGKKINVDSNILSKGDQVYLTPSGDFDKVLLTLKSATDGSIKEVTINKGEALVYTYDGNDNVTMSAMAYKDNKSLSCTPSVYKIVKALDVTTSGSPLLVVNSGESYSVSTVKQIKE